MIRIEAHAKINWSLDILGVREDGYHEMDMLMQTISMHDDLTIEAGDDLVLLKAEENAGTCIQNHEKDRMSSAEVSFDENNLVIKAARVLQQAYGISAGAHITLKKEIPSGAGLGGGSADAAAALIGLNHLWGRRFSIPELMQLGVRIGADVPFQLQGGFARVGGIGDQVTALTPAPAYGLVMLQPCGGLSTREVFLAFEHKPPEVRPATDKLADALCSGNKDYLNAYMGNVLQPVSEEKRPQIKEAIRLIYDHGAISAMMSGSGSVVYGVYQDLLSAQKAAQIIAPAAQQKGWGKVWAESTLPDNGMYII